MLEPHKFSKNLCGSFYVSTILEPYFSFFAADGKHPIYFL